jgi:hypothetical protein
MYGDRMDVNRCPTCGSALPPTERICEFCATANAAGAADCPSCGAPLPIGAVFCVSCGFDLRSGQKRLTVDEKPRAAASEWQAQPHFGRGVHGLVARAIYSLREDWGSSPSARIRGLQQVGFGFLVLVAWVAAVLALGYLLTEVVRPALQARFPARAGQPAPAAPFPGFGWILFLTIFPAVWSILRIIFGLFQFVSAMSFAEFHDWFENLPLWAILLLLPVLLAVVVPAVVVLLVGTLGVCGFIFRLVTG